MTPAHFLPDHLSRPDTAFTHASYHLDVTGAPGAAALSVVSWRLRERLGRSWRLTLKVTHPEPLVREDVLGKDATFTLAPAPGESIPLGGWISGVTHLRTSRDLSTYRVVVDAHLARLSLTPASRIFQKQTAPQIIEALFVAMVSWVISSSSACAAPTPSTPSGCSTASATASTCAC